MPLTKEAAGQPARGAHELRLVAWEVTRRCPLHCRHCRASAADRDYECELTTGEAIRFLDNLASWANPLVILTGGEPLERPDILTIARFGTRKGLRMVMASCGWRLDAQILTWLQEAGIRRLSLSLDGVNKETHDSFRQVPGSFDAVARTARLAREKGLEFQINTTISKLNCHQLAGILALAKDWGAAAFHPFLLVPTGRASELRDYELDAVAYEKVLLQIYKLSQTADLAIKPTCAPQFYRILRQKEQAAGRQVTFQTHGLNGITKGCLGGQAFAFISHTGSVHACGFLEIAAGNLKSTGLHLQPIWEKAPVFQELRNPANYRGKCGYCEYRPVCGGCRARAQAKKEHYLEEEPYCVYVPQDASHSLNVI